MYVWFFESIIFIIIKIDLNRRINENPFSKHPFNMRHDPAAHKINDILQHIDFALNCRLLTLTQSLIQPSAAFSP